MNEYMENGYVSVALGPIVLPALYFIGTNLSKDVVESSEYYATEDGFTGNSILDTVKEVIYGPLSPTQNYMWSSYGLKKNKKAKYDMLNMEKL